MCMDETGERGGVGGGGGVWESQWWVGWVACRVWCYENRVVGGNSNSDQ
jgi:hypothetical protein